MPTARIKGPARAGRACCGLKLRAEAGKAKAEQQPLAASHYITHKPADPLCPHCLAKMKIVPAPPTDDLVCTEIKPRENVGCDTLTSETLDCHGNRYMQCTRDRGSGYRRRRAHHSRDAATQWRTFRLMLSLIHI